MKKLFFAFAVVAMSLTAYAVSIEVTDFTAVAIGDLKTVTSDDGFTKEHTISFMGPGLSPLMFLLPPMKDIETPEDTILEYKRGFSVSQENPSSDNDKKLFFECQKADGNDKGVSCTITLIVGVIPG